MKCVGAVIVLVMLVAAVLSAAHPHEITALPGIDHVPFKQYAGEVEVDAAHQKKLFYWFVESQGNPSTDPLLLWMNGGPGASSLLGLFTENGPFRVLEDGKTLELFPYSWNRVANVIYVEAPCGVGFSTSNDAADYTTGDNQTAADNLAFLKGWFELFPQFKKNPFYVTGESYGGHYVPQLTEKIVASPLSAEINLKGLLVGNPGTEMDWFFNTNEYAFFTFMYTHGLLAQSNYTDVYRLCEWDQFLHDCERDWVQPVNSQCAHAQNAVADHLMNTLSPFNFYDVLAPACLSGNNMKRYLSPARQSRFDPNVPFFPCSSDYMSTYLNMPEVQKAIHAPAIKWTWISSVLRYVQEDPTVVPTWHRLINHGGLRLMVFSGDTDASVPFIGTQRWIECLKRPVVSDFQPWLANAAPYGKQIAGSFKRFDGITFLTVKGAGHMVPMFKPEAAFEMAARFLAGEFA